MNQQLRNYLELLRFPAVFTLVSNVMMAYLVARGDLHPPALFAIVLLASSFLYLGGMVLNDVYDVDLDACERPDRPLPSGRISLAAARRIGWSLLAGGVLLFVVTGQLADALAVGISSLLLAGAIWLYDAAAKRTPLAPLAMGLCRGLNVALVMGIATYSLGPAGAPFASRTERIIALGIALYIGGVTWFARGEARSPNRLNLLGGMAVMLVGLLLLEQSAYAELRPANAFTESENWPLLWFALGAVVLGRCLWATWKLDPRATQTAVRSSLRAIIMIDAALVFGYCGPAWGWTVLALLVPMLLAERWASTT